MALYGLYGKHTIDNCPLNNKASAQQLLNIEKAVNNLNSYQINNIIGQYHSGLEHTFIWIVDAQDPHLIQQFAIDSGAAKFHDFKIVPITEFSQVVKTAKQAHNL